MFAGPGEEVLKNLTGEERETRRGTDKTQEREIDWRQMNHLLEKKNHIQYALLHLIRRKGNQWILGSGLCVSALHRSLLIQNRTAQRWSNLSYTLNICFESLRIRYWSDIEDVFGHVDAPSAWQPGNAWRRRMFFAWRRWETSIKKAFLSLHW